MSEVETIARIAAKGDGVTQSGRHVQGAVPGDTVDADGRVEPGPHRAEPPCPHFGRCGGCQLQYADEATLSDFVTSRVLNAAHGQRLEPQLLLATHLSPPHTRRRGTLHAIRTQKGALIGFRESGSHRIVDLTQCDVLSPELAAQIPSLREFIAQNASKGTVDVGLALCDQGVDLTISNLASEGLEETELALDYARTQNLARLSVDHGYGPETVWEPEPVTITLSGNRVPMPVGAFLQATADAEARMVADAFSFLDGAGPVVDLFAGLGTFALALAEQRKVLGVEADRAAYLALKATSGRSKSMVHAMHRDLFRNPLQPTELNRFDAAVLDPPRAGARTQVAEIAASDLARVVYVSCNPSSWSRDAATLTQAGFALEALRPVGQFRWSTHVELISLFTRQ
ncbi:MAG: class I SAM-dependent RNA methyltransferase [Erythrobacter sp.]|uniref:class I SAM-dependent RNA methyltransferase n=1 Tax=Erythrobacter sp. TaxID=1042 RepID=UPI00262808BD|nr:class I SAM-dependent RNA methyltransferase [Erythrobacter sp.]MDJ0977863.1 class I SAM-dependent RNA methyltransferase [Erythrobacter sp.]